MCRFFKKKEKRTGRDTSKPWWISNFDSDHIGIGEDAPDWAKRSKNVMPNLICPYCHSNKAIDAGYGSRMKCRNCGRIFS
jgi:hypothetical protein